MSITKIERGKLYSLFDEKTYRATGIKQLLMFGGTTVFQIPQRGKPMTVGERKMISLAMDTQCAIESERLHRIIMHAFGNQDGSVPGTAVDDGTVYLLTGESVSIRTGPYAGVEKLPIRTTQAYKGSGTRQLGGTFVIDGLRYEISGTLKPI